MTLVLPSTVEELNLLQNSMELPSPLFAKVSNKGFENIPTEKKYKREVSFPNGVENWNIGNFDSYLSILEDNPMSEFKVIRSVEDRLVPEEGDQRQRCESFSSVSSSMDTKRAVYQNFGVKSFSTVCMDSGSTCISSDHTYVGNDSAIFKGLDAEETYQNLDMFLQQVPEINMNDSVPSPLSSTDSFELPSLHSNFSLHATESQDVFLDTPHPTKRPAETSCDDTYVVKAARYSSSSSSPSTVSYTETRKKATTTSKHCRKTRKEKQKEMEVRVSELESEKEGLKVQVQMLEELIQAHQMKLYAILQKR